MEDGILTELAKSNCVHKQTILKVKGMTNCWDALQRMAGKALQRLEWRMQEPQMLWLHANLGRACLGAMTRRRAAPSMLGPASPRTSGWTTSAPSRVARARKAALSRNEADKQMATRLQASWHR